LSKKNKNSFLYGLLGGYSEKKYFTGGKSKKYFTGGKPGNDLYYRG
jgi:hypothetical protein